MRDHWRLLSYVLRHKWFVWRSGRLLGVPWWALAIHDLDKLTPAMWMPYLVHFYRTPATRPNAAGESVGYFHDARRASDAFNRAWLGHIHRSRHHWQYFLLRNDDGTTRALRMPDRFVREMVADWMGAGMAQGHGNDVSAWYAANAGKMELHDETRRTVALLVALGAERG